MQLVTHDNEHSGELLGIVMKIEMQDISKNKINIKRRSSIS
jgi:hypothetical protein